MLGYFTQDGAGRADALMAEVASHLRSRAWPLAGVVQVNTGAASDGRCHMDLEVLGTEKVIRISQDLGPQAKGCRLDTGALETAVGYCEAAIASAPRLCIVNKFGKQEIDGKGFRPLIGRAVAEDIPVLCAVGPAHVDGFLSFAGDLASPVEPTLEAILDWVDGIAAEKV